MGEEKLDNLKAGIPRQKQLETLIGNVDGSSLLTDKVFVEVSIERIEALLDNEQYDADSSLSGDARERGEKLLSDLREKLDLLA